MLLIVGQDSLIGNALLREAASRGVPHAGTSRRPGAAYHLDLARPQSEWHLPDAVTSAVICAGIPGIAHCEKNPEATRRINVDATISLADLLASKGAHVTFLSSNQVFAPDAEAPDEDHPVNPVTEYGRQKAAVEEHLRARIPCSCVVRLTKVVSPALPLFAGWTESLRRGERIQAFEELFFSPLAPQPVAAIVTALASARQTGTFHLSPNDSISYCQAALWISNQAGADPALVEPTNAPNPNTPASCRLTSLHSHPSIANSIAQMERALAAGQSRIQHARSIELRYD